MGTETATKKTKKYTARYWSQQLTDSETRHKKFFEQAQESIKVYNTTHNLQDIQRKLNCWWYLVQTLLPAYYSSTPQCETKLRKNAGSSIYQLVATTLERNIQYAMEEFFDFDAFGLNSASQLLLTGRTVSWARYGAETEEKEVEYDLMKGDDGLVDANGKRFEGDETKLRKRRGNRYTFADMMKEKVSEECVLDLVQYCDYLTSDGRNESEIEWRARRAYMSEEQVLSKFGSDIAESVSYDAYPETIQRDRIKEQDLYQGKAELWEIWCEVSGKVYWVQKKGDKSIIEEGEPPVKYEDFYPCVVINNTTDPDSTIPCSDYQHCRDQIIEVERLTTRIHAVTQAIRTNTAYDSTMKELDDLMTGDLKMIPVTSWPAYKSRGGLSAGLEFLPIEPYIKALEVLTQARQVALQQLYDTLKASDLLRGTSDPKKTATANRLENQWSSLGLIVRQNQFAKFIGKSISKLGTIISQQFSDEKILDVGEFMEQVQPLVADIQDPQQQMMQVEQIKQQVLQAIRDDTERCIHIQVASDTMVALDEQQDREDGQVLMQSAGAFFGQMQQLIEQYPPFAVGSVELFKNVIRRYRGGKELEPIFTQMLAQVGPLSEQKQQQQSQTPPTPGVIEAQARLQIAQMQSQDNHQKNMMELQNMQLKAQMEQQKMQLDAATTMKEMEMKAQALQIEIMKVQITDKNNQATQALGAQKLQIDGAKGLVEAESEQKWRELQGMIEGQKLINDRLSIRLDMAEKMMEERRLAQVELGQKAEVNKPKEPAQPKLPDIHVNVDARQPVKKKSTIIKTPTGYDVQTE